MNPILASFRPRLRSLIPSRFSFAQLRPRFYALPRPPQPSAAASNAPKQRIVSKIDKDAEYERQHIYAKRAANSRRIIKTFMGLNVAIHCGWNCAYGGPTRVLYDQVVIRFSDTLKKVG